MMRGISVITAGTGIHRGDEHKGTWVFHCVFRTTDGDLSVFERLTEYFEGGLVEFRKFVEKEDAIMRHTHFARQGSVATASHRYL